MSTPTPRTDAKTLTVAQRTSPHYLPEMVWADFARELERELATERETSRLLKVAMDARDEGYTQSRRHMSELERAIVGFKRDGAYAKGWDDHIASIMQDWLNREQALRKAAAELTFWLEHAREADMHESARGALAVVKEIRALLPPNIDDDK